jgi:hypothetical protein
MTLKELISQIEDKRAEAALSVEDSDPRVRAGVEATIRNAVRALEQLETDYKDAVIPSAVLIAVEGNGSKEFADTARIAFDTPAVDYEGVTNRIIKSVKERSGRSEFNTQEFFMVLDELNKIKLEYGILSLPTPRVNAGVDKVYNFPIEEAIRTLLKVNYDEQLNSVVTRREIGKLALGMKFVGKNLPVVVYNYRGSLDEQYLPRPLVTVTATLADVNKDFVKEVLTQVKNRLTGGNSRSSRKRTEPASTATAFIEQTKQQTKNKE